MLKWRYINYVVYDWSWYLYNICLFLFQHQIASLLSLSTSSESDLVYQKGLEDSLASTKSQLEEYILKCTQLEKKITNLQTIEVVLFECY